MFWKGMKERNATYGEMQRILERAVKDQSNKSRIENEAD